MSPKLASTRGVDLGCRCELTRGVIIAEGRVAMALSHSCVRQRYDKVQQGLVEKKHLDMRVHMLRTGIFRSPTGERVWKFWMNLRDAEFADWFEKNIVDPSTTVELVKRMQEENPELFNELKGGHEKSENSFFRVD